MLRRPASNGPVHESVQQLLDRCAREARSPSPECTDLCSSDSGHSPTISESGSDPSPDLLPAERKLGRRHPVQRLRVFAVLHRPRPGDPRERHVGEREEGGGGDSRPAGTGLSGRSRTGCPCTSSRRRSCSRRTPCAGRRPWASRRRRACPPPSTACVSPSIACLAPLLAPLLTRVRLT